MAVPADVTANDEPESAPENPQSSQGAVKPIVTPLTHEDAQDLAYFAIYLDIGDLMVDRVARALIRVDVASRKQACIDIEKLFGPIPREDGE